MKITNNRTRGAWFNYRVAGKPSRIYLKPFESAVVEGFNDIDQTLHNRTLSNFADEKPVADSGQTTNISTVRKVKSVDASKRIHTSQQLSGNFDIKYSSE